MLHSMVLQSSNWPVIFVSAALTEANDRSPNTYTHGMMSDLDDAIIKARFDDDVSCIVLTGNGSSFFSAGASIQMLNSVSPGFKYNFCLHANETLSRLEQTPKLVVCAINGHAVGGGLEIAMVLISESLVRTQERLVFLKSTSVFSLELVEPLV